MTPDKRNWQVQRPVQANEITARKTTVNKQASLGLFAQTRAVEKLGGGRR